MICSVVIVITFDIVIVLNSKIDLEIIEYIGEFRFNIDIFQVTWFGYFNLL